MEKQQALYEFLIENGDFTKEELDLDDLEESSYCDSTFEISPRQERFGTSPQELRGEAENLRFVLNLLFSAIIEVDDLKSDQVSEKLYRIVDKYMKALFWTDSGEDSVFYQLVYKKVTGKEPVPVEEGKHDNPKAHVYQKIVNFLFHLYSEPSYGRDKFQNTCKQAFDGLTVDEYRELQNTNSGEYLVLTEDEADEKAREGVESYIDDCLEIPKHIENYFDRERYIDDILSYDGRASQLASYDGEEHEYDEYYIYKMS